jgi:polar amino acid transport system substrate-binding protein
MRFLGACLAAICLMWSSAGSAAEVVRAAYEDKPLPPFYMGNGTDIDPQAPGVSVELLREAAAAAGVEIHFVRMPWARCLKSLQRGEVDAIFNASFKEERLEAGVYPMAAGKPDPARRITTLADMLYRLKGGAVTWDGRTIGGLGDAPVGIQGGYSIVEDLTRMGVKSEESADTATIFKKLASGRIPAAAQLEASGDATLALGSFAAIEKMQPPLVTKDYFLMFSHQYYDAHRPSAERLWSKLAEVRDRRSPALFAKYAR